MEHIGYILKEMGRTQEAEALIVESFKYQTQLLSPYSKAMEILHESMAEFNTEKEQYANAEWHYRQAIDILNHGLAEFTPDALADVYISLSRVVKLRDVREAAQCLLSAIRIFDTAQPSRRPAVYQELAQLHVLNNMPAEGVSFYEQAVAIALQNSALTSDDKDTLIDICSELGDCLSAVLDYDKAMHYYGIGIAAVADRDPTDPRGKELIEARESCEQKLKGGDEEQRPESSLSQGIADQPAESNMVQLSENQEGSVADEDKALLP